MAPTVKTLLPPTRSGRTLAIALSLLGGVALVQLLVLGGYLIGGGVPSHRPASAANGVPPLHPGDATQPVSPILSPTVAPTPGLPTPAPAVSLAPPAPVLERPTPAPAVRVQNSSVDLLEQARQLRSRGDMNSALARLREAQVAEPDNAQIIAEMAATYEAMQIPDRAFEQWQRLYNLGDSAGVLYDLAKFKLQSVPSAPAASATPGTAGPAAATDGNPFPSQGDAILKFTDIHAEIVQDPAAEQKVALRIVVKNRPGTAVDPMKVRILTYFYDLVDGEDIVLTDAQTAFAWLTPGRVDWADDKSEILETTYLRPKAAPAPTPAPAATPAKKGSRHGKAAAAEASAAATPTPAPAQVRTYLGYSVRLYYDRQLQDVQADPVRLLQKFPPPMTLSPD